MARSIGFGCASNNDAVLAANLAASPDLLAGARLDVQRNAPSATLAGNRLLDAAQDDILVLLHHDVWLPRGWLALLHQRLDELERIDPAWAVAGAFGVAPDYRQWGPVWTSSLGQIVGRVPMQPEPVQSLDEMLIVIRRASGLRFDEAMPGWHFYGTDIVCQARKAGMGAYALGLPCIHNDRFDKGLGADFTDGYRRMQRKWAEFLPVQTPVTKISRSGLHLMRERWNMRQSLEFRVVDAVPTETPPQPLAQRCGWLDLSANLGPAGGPEGEEPPCDQVRVT